MPGANHKPGPIGSCVLSLALGLALQASSPSLGHRTEPRHQAAPSGNSSIRMAAGKEWMTRNLDVHTLESYCYGEDDSNCRRYGRLYTWKAARLGCESLGDGWRLPTNQEWRQMAKDSGGIVEDSEDAGRSAFESLLIEGGSGFNALLGGGRNQDGRYARLGAHGFYWTASESGPGTAWFYNFARGAGLLNRHPGDQKRAFSVRCVKGR